MSGWLAWLKTKHDILQLSGREEVVECSEGWGVVEDFLEEAELEIGRKKKAFNGGHFILPFPGLYKRQAVMGQRERGGAVVLWFTGWEHASTCSRMETRWRPRRCAG